MKWLLILLIWLPFSLQSQGLQLSVNEKERYSLFTKTRIGLLVSGVVYGSADGLRDIITHRWSDFERVFPKADPQNWNPKVSWRNKYRGGDPDKGARFPLSTTLLVPLTDWDHGLKFIHNTAAVAGIWISLNEIGQKPFWQFVIDALSWSIGRSIGFNVVWEGINRT